MTHSPDIIAALETIVEMARNPTIWRGKIADFAEEKILEFKKPEPEKK